MSDADALELPHHVRAMLSPQTYPHPAEDVELRQTHISYLLFAGDFVYKVKKPLDLGFLDFTTLEKRRHFCEEELRLNRRLCDQTYLAVVRIVVAGGGVRLDAEGEIVDYAVLMRRLPDEGMMTLLLAADAVTPDMVRRLALRIAEFHNASERSAEIDRYGRLDTAMGNWRENFEQTQSFIGWTISQRQFDEIQAFVERVAARDESLFELRVGEGRARDCHGDLRADAVCFEGDDVCIFDCIEFNERFRLSDVAADIAFIAMDLEDRGRQDLSDAMMGTYLGATLDSTLPLVLPFYKCYRAYVRGKVDGFQLDQPEVAAEQKTQATNTAHRYFALAHRYAMQTTPRSLIITAGVTGSGKSSLAHGLAARLGAFFLSSDVVRKRLAGFEPTERRFEPIYAGTYSPQMSEHTYQALLDEARIWLERGKAVILDATYLMRSQREAAVRLAHETNTPFLALECQTEESLIRERLARRRGEDRAVSDGRWEVYEAQKQRREPIDELAEGEHLVIDTALPLTDQIDLVVDRLGVAAQ